MPKPPRKVARHEDPSPSRRLASLALGLALATMAPAWARAQQDSPREPADEVSADAPDAQNAAALEEGAAPEDASEEEFFVDQDDYPAAYADRALTLRRFQVRGDLGVFIDRTSFPDQPYTETLVSLGVGAAVGVTSNFEIGFGSERLGARRSSSGLLDTTLPGTLIPVVLDHGAAGNMALYARARFFGGGKLEIAADLGFVLPTAGDATILTNVDFGLFLAAVLRVHLAPRVSFDTGLQFDLALVEGEGADNLTSLDVPMLLTLGVFDAAWIGLETGVRFPDVDLVSVPLGFQVGYALAVERFLLDIVAEFDFPALVNSNGAQARAFLLAPDTVGTEHWMVSVVTRFHARAGAL